MKLNGTKYNINEKEGNVVVNATYLSSTHGARFTRIKRVWSIAVLMVLLLLSTIALGFTYFIRENSPSDMTASAATDYASTWSTAVQNSLNNNGAVQNVYIADNWTAQANNSNGFNTTGNSNAPGFKSGMLYVPKGASIALRFNNNYTINRNNTSARGYGSVFYVEGTLRIYRYSSYSGYIRGGYTSSSNSAGGIYIANGGVVTQEAGIYVLGNNATYGYSAGGVYVANGGTYNLAGGYVGFTSNNSSYPGNKVIISSTSSSYYSGAGGVYVQSGGTFNMTSGGIYYNSSNTYNAAGGLMVESGATAKMSGGSIYYNTTNCSYWTSAYGGGGVRLMDNAKFDMTSGSICYNTASNLWSAGGVYMASGSTFNMAGTISNNTANGGAGAVLVYDKSTFTMNSGTMQNNSVGSNGTYSAGAVYVGGSMIMKAGTIGSRGGLTGYANRSSNTASGVGGIFVRNSGSLSMGGGYIIVYNNSSSTKTTTDADASTATYRNNVYFESNTGKIKIIGSFSSSNSSYYKVGISRNGQSNNYTNDRFFTEGWTNYSHSYNYNILFASDDIDNTTSGHKIWDAVSGQEAALECRDNQQNWINAVAASSATNTVSMKLYSNWTGVSNSSEGLGTNSNAFSAGRIYLPANKKIILNMAGYTINRNLGAARSSGGSFLVGGNLELQGTGYIQGGYNNSSSSTSGIYVSGGTFTLNGPTIRNNTTTNTYSGAAAYVTSSGTFNFIKGAITGNTANGATSAGGVYVVSGSTFTMDGDAAYLYANKATSTTSAGGVYTDGTFNMYAGRIGAYKSGSSVYSSANTTSYADGAGGVFVAKNGTINVKGASYIQYNTCSSLNSNVFLSTNDKAINVIGALSGTIGISRNYNGKVTKDFGKYNPSYNPSNRFYSDNTAKYQFLNDGDTAETREAFLRSQNNSENWYYYVNKSIKEGTTETVTLTGDWTATSNSSYGTSFDSKGNSTGGYSYSAFTCGRIYVPSGAKMILDLKTFTINRNLSRGGYNYGGVFYVEGELTLKGTTGSSSGTPTIKGGYSYTTNSYSPDSGNSYSFAGGIHIAKNGKVTLDGPTITANMSSSHYSAGGVFVHTGATFNFVKGYITGNSVDNYYGYGRYAAGGVLVWNGGTFNMSGSSYIQSNISRQLYSAGGVYLYGTAVMNMTGGQIGGSTSYANQCAYSASDCENVNSNIKYTVGGLYVDNNATFNLGGSAYVRYNKRGSSSSYTSDIYLANVSGKINIVSALSYKSGVERRGFANNYTDARYFTKDWSKYNSGKNPTSYFEPFDADKYQINSSTSEPEAAFLCKNEYWNWYNAVYASIATGDQLTVTMYHDWTATQNSTAGFGSDSNNKAYSNGRLTVYDGANIILNMNGKILNRNLTSAYSYGGIINVTAKGTLTIRGGGTLQNGYSSSYTGGLLVYGTCIMENATITNCRVSTTYAGGGVYVAAGGEFSMTNSSSYIKNCYAYNTNCGGAVFLGSGSTTSYAKFNLTRGTISNSYANYDYCAGGVYIRPYAQFNMNGSSYIQNCTSSGSYSAGGVLVKANGVFTMTAGTIGSHNSTSYGNRASTTTSNPAAGGVYVCDNATFNYGGTNTYVYYNFKGSSGTTQKNVYLEGATTMINIVSSIGTSTSYRRMGVSRPKNGPFTVDYEKYNSYGPTNFFVSEGNYTINYAAVPGSTKREALFVSTSNAENWEYAVTMSISTGLQQTCKLVGNWSGTILGSTSNGFYNGQLFVPSNANVVLDMNGYTINRSMTTSTSSTYREWGSVIRIAGKLEIKGNSNSKITGGNCYSTNYQTRGSAGGIHISDGGYLLLNGPTISGNYAYYTYDAGGVYVGQNATFEFFKGAITGNYANNTRSAGGVHVYDNGKFIMNGADAYIYGNGFNGGAGLYGAGGVYLSNSATMEMTAGRIGSYKSGSSVYSSGNTSSDKTTGTGGIYVRSSATFGISGTSHIWYNTCNSLNSNLYLENQTGKVKILGQFTGYCGVERAGYSNNYATTNHYLDNYYFTEGWKVYNGTNNPTSYFTTNDSARYTIVSSSINPEVAFFCKNNSANWQNAVRRSQFDKSAQQVTLYSDWNAATVGSVNGSFSGPFSASSVGYSSGRLYVPEGANIVLNMGEFDINRGLTSSMNYGGIFCVEGSLQINGSSGAIISGGYNANNNSGSTQCSSTGGIHVDKGGSVVFKGPTLQNCRTTASYTGGAVYVGNGSTFTLEGGYIGNGSYPNWASNTYSAGGVYVTSGGTFNMKSGYMYYNRATTTSSSGYSAGAVYVSSGATFNMSAGYMYYNWTNGGYSAGAVYLAGAMKMTGGYIGSSSKGDTSCSNYVNNSTNGATSTGGVFVRNTSTASLALSGSSWIANNRNVYTTSATKTCGINIFLQNATAVIDIIGNIPTTSSSYRPRFGINRPGNGEFTKGYGKYNTQSIYDVFKTDGTYSVKTSGSGATLEAALLSSNNAENWTYAVKTSLATKTTQTVSLLANWVAPRNNTTGFGTSNSDGYDNGRLYVPAGASIILNLAGYTLDRNLTASYNYGNVLYVVGELTINGTGYIQGGYNSSNNSWGASGGIHIYSGGKVTLNNNVYVRNCIQNANSGGGAVFVANGATFTMNSNTYLGQSGYANRGYGSYNGGAVYVAGGGTFNFAGKYIEYNTVSATRSAGAVYVASGGIFKQTAGYIRYNTASNDYSAGGVYLAGNMSFEGGYVGSGANTATKATSAGGIYVASSGNFSCGGSSTCSGNTANSKTSNVYLESKLAKINILNVKSGSIGIRRAGDANNYSSDKYFTSGWREKGNTSAVNSYFFPDDSTEYTIGGGNTTTDPEGYFFSKESASNWSNAVALSMEKKIPVTVTLYKDWIAENGSFGSGTGYSNGRLYVPSTAQIILEMGSYDINRNLGGANSYGSVFLVYGSLEINGNSSAYIRGGYTASSWHGAGIYLYSSGSSYPASVTLNGPTIAYNRTTASSSAGGVFVGSNCTFTMKSGYIGASSNANSVNSTGASRAAGGVFVDTNGTFNMAGGYIRYNTATGQNNGAGVYLAGTMNMTEGQIGYLNSSNSNDGSYANNATQATSAGGIYLASSAKLSVGGNTGVYNNIVNGSYTRDMVFDNVNTKIKITAAFNSYSYRRFGIYRTAVGIFTEGYGASSSYRPVTTVFRSQSNFTVTTVGTGTDLEGICLSTNNADNWAYAVKTSINTKTQQTVTLVNNWTASGGSFGSGTGYEDYRISVPAGADIVLNLNNYTINRNLTSSNTYGSVMYVAGKLAINGAGIIQGGYNGRTTSWSQAGGIHVATNGELTLTNVTIQNNKVVSYSSQGSAIYVSSGATVTMKSGSIGASGNPNIAYTSYCAPVYVASGGTFNMEAGYINYNTTPNNSDRCAGGVFIAGGGTFNMSGGYIGYNTSQRSSLGGNYCAGGVYCVGNFNMTGGFIRGNYVSGKYSAGAVRLMSGTFTMTGGQIGSGSSSTTYQNYASDETSVGGVYAESGTVQLGNKPYIVNNNTQNTSYRGNLALMNPTAKATIVSPFVSGAAVYVYRKNVATDSTGSIITSGWTAQNPSAEPSSYFVAEDSSNYKIIKKDGEAAIWCLDNAKNWETAVNKSYANRTTETFMLAKAWTAASNSTYTYAFSTTSGSNSPYYAGALNVPANASIVLDLNGFTINRNLRAARSNGFVIFVRGKLEIIDSSTNNGGKITGGWTDNASYGSGIHVYSGTIVLKGGTITGNKGGYGVYVTTSAKVNMGDKPAVYNNYDASNNQANLYLASDIDCINIVSEVASTATVGLTRSTGYGTFTSGWSVFNGEDTYPEYAFTSDNSLFRVVGMDMGNGLEGMLLGDDNAANWQYAVQTSLKTGKAQLFQLSEDWIASRNANYNTAFGTNTTAYYYGALYVPSGANVTIDLNGYTLNRNYTGGNVFNVIGTLSIIDNSSSKAGKITGGSNGVYIYNNGLCTMQAGTITGNLSYGVYAYKGTFNMTGGFVKGNTAANVYVTANGNIKLGGSPVISNGAGTKNNLVLASATKAITITSAFTSSASVNVLREGVGPLTSGWGRYNSSTSPWTYMHTESTVFLETTTGSGTTSEAYLYSKDNNINWQYAVTTSLSQRNTQTVRLWSNWTAEGNGTYGTAFGTTSAYINGALYVPKGASVILDTYGYSVDRALAAARANGYVIYVAGTLQVLDSTATDSAPTPSIITGGYNNSGSSAGAVLIANGGVFTLNGPTISGNRGISTSASAGAVYAAGTFNLTKGKVTDNQGTNAGAVYVANTGTFNMSAGTTLKDNTATGVSGGAVYSAGKVQMSGGTITKNTGYAGAIYVANGGNYTMADGSITENTGTGAGGVYIANGTTAVFTMNGGSITNNTATSAGGLYVAGSANVNGGVISGNKATGEGANDGGGAAYIATTGKLTVKGGELKENVGLNGVRIYGSGALNLGGTAQIKDNVTAAGAQRDVYIVEKTNLINIVSAFESGANVGIMRDFAGAFTKGYGTYNTAAPTEYFFSNRADYSIFKTEPAAGGVAEVAAGIPVDKPTAIGTLEGETVPVYSGNRELIAQGFVSAKMTYATLPEGVKALEGGKFDAINAGEYVIKFTPYSDYCWSDGSVAEYALTAKIAPFAIALSWSDTEFDYDGTPHKPTATATNLIGADTCEVTVSGEQTDAGTYWATASALSNSNYTLEGGTNVKGEFVINKIYMTLGFEETTAVYKQEFTLKVTGNVENGEVSYTVTNGTGTATVEGDKLMPTKVGTVNVTAVVAETRNYLETSYTGEIVIEKAPVPIELQVAEATYGTPLELQIKDYGEPGVASFEMSSNDTGVATIAAGSNVLVPVSKGEVTVKVSVTETENYKATAALVKVTILPLAAQFSWTNTEFTYDGNPHIPTVVLSNLMTGDSCDMTVSGEATDAGSYTAQVTKLENENYTLEGAVNIATPFVIKQAPITLTLTTTTAVFNQELELKVSGNLGNGTETYTVTDGTGKGTVTGNKLLPTWVGDVLVTVKVAETKNYLAGEVTGTVNIEQADPDIELSTKEAIYGTPLTLAVDGNEENGVVTFSLLEDEANATLTDGVLTPIHVGTVNIVIDVAETHNYKAAHTTGEVLVNPRPVELSWENLEFMYNGSNHLPTATVSNLVEGDTCVVTVSGEAKNAGTNYTATATALDNVNYTLTNGKNLTTGFVVKPLVVELSWKNFEFTYNGQVQAPEATVSNLISGDSCTVTVLGTKDAGTMITALATGLSNANYTLEGCTNTMQDYTINPLKAILDWSDLELVYNGEEQGPTAKLSNLCSGDTCEVTVGGKQVDAGTYTATALALSNSNYTLTDVEDISISYTIEKAPLNLTLHADTATYGTEQEIEVEGNLGNGEIQLIITNDTGSATAIGNVITPTHIGTIKVHVIVVETPNYKGADDDLTLTIVPRIVDLDWTVGVYTYNGKEQAPTAEVDNLVTGDTCEVTVAGSVDAGTGLTAKATALSNENYTITGSTSATTTFDIQPLKAELDWEVGTYVYNGKEQAPTAKVTNLIGEDKCEVTVIGKKDVGTGHIATATGVTNSNYTIEGSTNIIATFDISPLPVEIAWSNLTLTYNGIEQAPTAKVGNICDGDNCSVTLTGAQVNAGKYTATVTAISNPNYTLAGGKNLSSPYTIEKAQRSVALETKTTVYGTKLTLTISGNSENGTVSYTTVTQTGSATISGAVLTPTQAGTVGVVITVAETANYAKTTANDSVEITPLPVALKWENLTFTYDGNPHKPTASVTGLIGTDTCEVTVSGEKTNAGTHTATATALSNTNYTLTGATNTTSTFTIEKAPITIQITTTRATYGTPLKLEVSGNLGNGAVHYTATNMTGAAVVDDSGNLAPTKFGTVSVTATVDATENYLGATTTEVITISRGPAPLVLETNTATYGTPRKLIVSGNDEDATISYEITDGKDCATISGDVLTPTKVGTVTIAIKSTETSNYNATTVTTTLTVKPRPVELLWSMVDFTYNGSEQAPSAEVTNLVSGDTCTVTVTGQKDAGEMNVATATAVSNPNYTVEGSDSATTTYVIKPLVAEIAWEDLKFTYDGEEHVPTAKLSNVFTGDEYSLTVEGGMTDAGTYMATVTAIDNTNYTLEGAADLQHSFEIERAKISIDIKTIEVFFGNELKLEVIGNVGNGEVTYTKVDGTGTADLSGDTLIPTKVGTVTVTAHVGETANTFEAEKTVTITIHKGQMALSLQDTEVTYGNTLEIVVLGNDENGTMKIEAENDSGEAILTDTTLTPVKVGTVKVIVTVSETDNYSETTFTGVVTISPKKAELSWNEFEFTYNGLEQAPAATVTNLEEGDECAVTVTGSKNAGTDLTATATTLSNGNYTLEGVENLTATFTIKALKVELEWKDVTLAYNGSVQAPTATVKNLQEDDTCTITVSSGETLPGKYEATAIGLSDTNYTLEGVENLTTAYEITKGYLDITLSASDEVVYNVPVTLSVSGNLGNGAVTYTVVSGTADIDGNTLTAKSAGTIAVKASVEETDLYFAAEATAAFNAEQGETSIALVNDTTVYGTDLTLEITGNDENGTVEYKIVEGGTGKAEINGNVFTPKQAGTVKVSITVGATASYASCTAEVEVTITPRLATITWSNTTFTYDGTAHVPTATVSNLLEADAANCNVTVTGEETNAGKYSATATALTGDKSMNYTLEGADNLECEFTIEKAELTITIPVTSAAIGVPVELKVNGNLGNGEVEYSIVGGKGEATIADGTFTGTKVGSVIVKALVAETDNYKEGTAQVIVQIAKNGLTLGLATTQTTYGDSMALTVTGNIDDSEVEFTITDQTGSAIMSGGKLKALKAGTVLVTITAKETANHSLSTAQVVVTIQPRQITGITWTVEELVYNGTAQSPKATIGGLLAGDDCEVIISGAPTDAGLYEAGKVKVTGLTNDNYTLGTITSSAPEFEILKAEPTLKLSSNVVTVGIPTTLTVEGNEGNGEITFFVTNSTGAASLTGDNNDVLLATKLGEVFVTITVTETANYQEFSVSEIVTVDKAALADLGLLTTETRYGEKLTLTAVGNGTASVSYAIEGTSDVATMQGDNVLVPLKVGTVKIKVTAAATETNRETSEIINVTVKPRVVELNWKDLEFVYNGEIQVPTAEVTNLLSGDSCNVTVEGAKNASTNATATATALDNENYTLTGCTDTTTSYVIKPRPVVIEWTMPTTDFVYNGSVQTPTAEVKNLVEGDECTVTVIGSADAGDPLTATVDSISNANYTLEGGENLTKEYCIKPLEVELTWGETELTYTGAFIAPVATIKGLVGEETCNVVVTGAKKHVGNDYEATATLPTSANYVIKDTECTTKFSIKAFELTLTNDGLQKEYTGEFQQPTFSATLANDTDILVINVEGGLTDVGTCELTLSLLGEAKDDYVLKAEDVKQTFEVIPKAVTLTVSSKDTVAQYTGSAIQLADGWYIISAADGSFVGQDEEKTIAQIFPNDTLAIKPLFRAAASATDLEEIISKGTYYIIPNHTGGTLGGNDNYTVTIKVNSNYGVLTVEGGEILELKLESAYKFITEVESDGLTYRRTYDELGITHGDGETNTDSGFAKIVLGQISPRTTVNEFMNNFKNPELIRLYRVINTDKGKEFELVYNGGLLVETFGSTVEQMQRAYNDIYTLAIGTGWKLEYGSQEKGFDVVYLSVLGDIDGNGFVNAEDVTRINIFIKQLVKLDGGENLEARLAMRISNGGAVTASDVAHLNFIIKGMTSVDDYFYKPSESELPNATE